ncbi:MAG: hypothetical protein CMC93_02440, partial [Flavobacteriaceae bacterium]|nr:hypothetical protein [Flavobacteriaceae bacterium]
MGVYKKLFLLRLLLCLLLSSISIAQTTDLNIDEVRVNGNLPPHEFCQGEVPTLTISFRLKAGSSTLTLTSTNTLDFNVVGSGSNMFNQTVTNVTS